MRNYYIIFMLLWVSSANAAVICQGGYPVLCSRHMTPSQIDDRIWDKLHSCHKHYTQSCDEDGYWWKIELHGNSGNVEIKR